MVVPFAATTVFPVRPRQAAPHTSSGRTIDRTAARFLWSHPSRAGDELEAVLREGPESAKSMCRRQVPGRAGRVRRGRVAQGRAPDGSVPRPQSERQAAHSRGRRDGPLGIGRDHVPPRLAGRVRSLAAGRPADRGAPMAELVQRASRPLGGTALFPARRSSRSSASGRPTPSWSNEALEGVSACSGRC